MSGVTSAPSCPERGRVAALLARRADDSISTVESRALKAHLLSCSSCAEASAAEDPTLLFVPLSVSAESRPSASRRDERRAAQASAEMRADAERVVADVLAAVEVERSRRRLGAVPMLRRHRRALLAASVALVGAGLLGWVSFRRAGVESVAALAGRPAASLPAAAAGSAPAAPAAPAELDRPVIEDLKNPGATVYEFASASPQEPTLVFIVDRNADI